MYNVHIHSILKALLWWDLIGRINLRIKEEEEEKKIQMTVYRVYRKNSNDSQITVSFVCLASVTDIYYDS